MIPHVLLGSYRNCHELLLSLFNSVPAADASRQFHPELGSLAWYLAKSVYLETYWLRERISGDDNLTRRVSHLFERATTLSLQQRCLQLPPQDHLTNWAAEIFDDNIMRLANPGEVTASPLMAEGRLASYLLQEHCRHYELMLAVLNYRQSLIADSNAPSPAPLQAAPPDSASASIEQGHYRIGARSEASCYDNEWPPQMVKLSAFRILTKPVSNAAYLGFMQDGGYAEDRWWSEQGRQWRDRSGAAAPLFWRQDTAGRWHGVGINGLLALAAEAPVSGLSQHEAAAFCNWAGERFAALRGAVLPHEFQHETADRLGLLKATATVWEWSSNVAQRYDGYQPWPDANGARKLDDAGYVTLKGGCLHSQPAIRRPSYRLFARPHERHHFSGFRLVLPPE